MNSAKWLSALCTVGLLTTYGATIAPAQETISAPTKAVKRLSPNVVPEHYKLFLHPDLTAATFSGDETIKLSLNKETENIILNSKELSLKSAEITPSAGGETIKLAIKDEPADEMVQLSAPKPLAAGEYILRLEFAGKLNSKLAGFYKSTFKGPDGKEHNLAVTQFEPTDARRMFPCFDEPEYKAGYQISVRTKSNLAAISNVAVKSEKLVGAGDKVVEFSETPRMSSYLVALLVGEFEPTPAISVNGIPIRVWSVAGKSHLGSYARDEAAHLLPALTNYFDIPYAWGKLDLIAIPDFEAGAMENPGAITFRETLLLVDPKTASSGAKRAVTSVTAHEMSHLWFGDLVTMKWWDDLWLNEAFATWSATRACNTIHPEWEMWKEYEDDRSMSMSTDALHSTRAIHADVSNPEQALEMFDVITYEKGASILRMLEKYVGEKNFQGGVHNYLAKHSLHNATTKDLWDAIDAEWRTHNTNAGESISSTMNSWVNQPGYPLVAIANTAGGITLQQHRFLELKEGKVSDSVWSIPLGFRTLVPDVSLKGQTDAQRTLLFGQPETEASFATVGAEGAYVANAGGVGYYRVKYPDANFTALQKNAGDLDPSERFELVSDTYALARTGDVSIDHFLNLAQSLKQDTDEEVLNALIGDIAALDSFVKPESRGHYERFIRDEFGPLMTRLGWEPGKDESQQKRMLRAHVVAMLGTLGQDARVISRARDLFAGYVKNEQSVDRDLVGPVTAIVAYNGTAADYAQIKTLYETAKTPETEERNLHDLAIFGDPKIVSDTLELAISGKVRIQDAPGLIGRLLSSRRTNAQAWEFITTHWPRITSLYAVPMVPKMMNGAGSFTTPEMLVAVQKFFGEHPMPTGETATKRTIERLKLNVQFAKEVGPQLNVWLSTHFRNA